ncbi:unnamed protein product [Boreogadus saida]
MENPGRVLLSINIYNKADSPCVLLLSSPCHLADSRHTGTCTAEDPRKWCQVWMSSSGESCSLHGYNCTPLQLNVTQSYRRRQNSGRVSPPPCVQSALPFREDETRGRILGIT